MLGPRRSPNLQESHPRNSTQRYLPIPLDIKSRQPWVPKTPRAATAMEQLSKDIKLFHEYIVPTELDHRARTLTLENTSEVINITIPGVTLLGDAIFVNKLYLPNDRITAYLCCTLPGHVDPIHLSSSLESTGAGRDVSVKGSGNSLSIEMHIPSTALDVQILGADQESDVATTISRLLMTLPALRPLYYIISILFNERGLMQPSDGGISCVSILCMIAFFLQKHDLGRSTAHECFGTLLFECLHWIGREFCWDTHGVTLNGGGVQFIKAKRLKVFHTPLAIEISGKYGINIGCDTTKMTEICEVSSEAWSNLSSALLIRDMELDHKRIGRITYDISDSPSLLGRIISIDPDTIIHRLRVVAGLFSALKPIGSGSIPSTIYLPQSPGLIPDLTPKETTVMTSARRTDERGHITASISETFTNLIRNNMVPPPLVPTPAIGTIQGLNLPLSTAGTLSSGSTSLPPSLFGRPVGPASLNSFIATRSPINVSSRTSIDNTSSEISDQGLFVDHSRPHLTKPSHQFSVLPSPPAPAYNPVVPYPTAKRLKQKMIVAVPSGGIINESQSNDRTVEYSMSGAGAQLQKVHLERNSSETKRRIHDGVLPLAKRAAVAANVTFERPLLEVHNNKDGNPEPSAPAVARQINSGEKTSQINIDQHRMDRIVLSRIFSHLVSDDTGSHPGPGSNAFHTNPVSSSYRTPTTPQDDDSSK